MSHGGEAGGGGGPVTWKRGLSGRDYGAQESGKYRWTSCLGMSGEMTPPPRELLEPHRLPPLRRHMPLPATLHHRSPVGLLAAVAGLDLPVGCSLVSCHCGGSFYKLAEASAMHMFICCGLVGYK